ncbi:hypothetical protein GC163_18550 [bacterium]|nr:hypothetical protein [bacterium]
MLSTPPVPESLPDAERMTGSDRQAMGTVPSIREGAAAGISGLLGWIENRALQAEGDPREFS